MANFIFIIFFIIEAVFVINFLITKTHQEKTKYLIHVSIFVIFLMLTISSVIQWHYRWYGFSILLLFWAIYGLGKLFRPSHEVYSSKQIIIRSTGSLILVFISLIPVLFFPQYTAPEPTGHYAISETKVTYKDIDRLESFADKGENRIINVQFWYPNDSDGVFPLIIFSHGGLGVQSSNTSLYHELASHGYNVASIGHPYHAFWTLDEAGKITYVSFEYLQEILSEDAKTDKGRSFEYYQKWMKVRTDDINFVLNEILNKSSVDFNDMYSMVDSKRIGLIGHSLGGSAALCVGRQRNDIDAVIALESPFMCDIITVENDQFVFTDKVYPLPVLNIYSDSSWENLSDWAQYAQNFALLTDHRSNAFNIHIEGVGHLSLTDLSLTSPMLVNLLDGQKPSRDSNTIIEIINRVCLSFFDQFLKNGEAIIHDGVY